MRAIAYKAGVRVRRRTQALDHLENCALQTQEELGYPDVLVVTSINDSKHATGSKHGTNEAEDYRTKGPLANSMGTVARKRRFRRRFQELLGDRFWVVLEGLGKPWEHLHGQVKKGHRYP